MLGAESREKSVMANAILVWDLGSLTSSAPSDLTNTLPSLLTSPTFSHYIPHLPSLHLPPYLLTSPTFP